MTSSRRLFVVSAALMATLIAATAVNAQEPSSSREITPLTDNLYDVRVDDQHTVFLVTTAGIVLVDPLDVETAQWLKDEVARRFTPGVVRYVIHTSHQFTRAEGASIFNDTAELVGHRQFNESLSAARRYDDLSYRRVHDIETHFEESRAISLGGQTVELVSAPSSGTPDNAIVNFPAERVAFASDAPPLEAVPFRFGSYGARDARRWLDAAAPLTFDTLVTGDGRVVRKDQITRLAGYVSALFQGVVAEYEAGRDAAGFAERRLPQAYRSDAAFTEWRANVSDVYRGLSVTTLDATVGVLSTYILRSASYCDGHDSCSGGGVLGAATTSLGLSTGRWGLVGEFIVTDTAYSSRTSRFYDEEVALRETRGAVMIRHDRPAGAVSTRWLGGLSYGVIDRRGMDRVKQGLPPFAGRHPIESRDSRFGLAGGLDIVMGRRIGIVVPLRFNYALHADSETSPSRMDAQAGVALTFRLLRSID
jgi:hypothetical protein